MKYILRNYISKFASYTEIFLSIIILVDVFIGSIGLIRFLPHLIKEPLSIRVFQEFLGYALALILAVEFIKMISRHTPGSAIEVLLFALARKLVVSEGSSQELLLGVIAIAILFIIKKYFVPVNNPLEDVITLSAATLIKKAREVTKLDIPEGIAQTLGGLVAYIAQKDKKALIEGDVYEINGVKMSVTKLRDGIIESVSFLKENYSKDDL